MAEAAANRRQPRVGDGRENDRQRRAGKEGGGKVRGRGMEARGEEEERGIDPIFQSRWPTVFEFRHKPLVPCRL